jgi:hypothetical protein
LPISTPPAPVGQAVRKVEHRVGDVSEAVETMESMEPVQPVEPVHPGRMGGEH